MPALLYGGCQCRTPRSPGAQFGRHVCLPAREAAVALGHQGLPFVEQFVADAVKRPGDLPDALPGPPGPTYAFPGDDGRHHLVRVGHMLCGDQQSPVGPTHRQGYSWVEGPGGPREWMGGRVDFQSFGVRPAPHQAA